MRTERPARPPGITSLAVGLLAVGVAVGAGSLLVGGPPASWAVVAVLAAAFALADRAAVHLEVGDQTITATLAEVILVAALFAVDPPTLTLAYVAGVVVPGAVVLRWPWWKVAVNLGAAAVQAGGAVLVAAAWVGAGPSPGEPLLDPARLTHWVVAAVAVQVSMAAATIAIAAAMRRSGAPEVRTAHLIGLGALATSGNTAVGLLAAVLIDREPPALVLLVGLLVVLAALYRSGAATLRRLERVQQLYEFTRTLASAPDLVETARTAMVRARGVLRCERVETILLDGDEPRLWVALADGGELEVVSGAWREDGTIDRVVRNGVPVRSDDALGAPLRAGDQVVGAMVVRRRTGVIGRFEDGDLEVFEALANHTAVSLQRDELVARLRLELEEKEHLTLHDALTGLPNRRAFVRDLTEAVREARCGGDPATVVMLDLNGFKDVNESFGHATGDALLIEVSQRLQRAVGTGGTVARLGGDEFAALVRVPVGRAVPLAERVIAVLGTPFALDDIHLTLGRTVGIAGAPDHAADPTTLLQRADLALYAAKDRRASEPHVFDPGDDRLAARRLALAAELRGALEREELTVVYQPKADISTGRIVGVEALLRWHHRDHGPVPPDEFVGIAEQTGSISTLTRYVLERAVRTAAGWTDRGAALDVAVNVSTRNLLEPRLPEVIAELLATNRFPAERLTLEITETELMQDAELTIATLGRLHDMGVKLSIDDFGTGYSSLAYLKRLPVDEVKIDKSFVFGLATDADDEAIAHSIVDLARSLGLHVVAEGVEDQRSWDLLHAMRCDTAQGYFLSRPIPAAELERWLAERLLVAPGGPDRRG